MPEQTRHSAQATFPRDDLGKVERQRQGAIRLRPVFIDSGTIALAESWRAFENKPSAIMLSSTALFSRGAVNGGVQVPPLLAKLVQCFLQRIPGLVQFVSTHAGKRASLRVRLQHEVFNGHRLSSFVQCTTR